MAGTLTATTSPAPPPPPVPGFDPEDPADLAELDRLAALGDPDAPLPEDAEPWRSPDSTAGADLLPDWYMPTPIAGTRSVTGWRRVLAWVLIVSALLVVASGLCNTYGELVVA